MSEREKRYQQALSHGHSAAWDQEWDRAATFYRQALDEMPDDPKALTNLALALFELQEHDESLRYYLRAAEVTPDDPVPLEKAATLYDILQKPDVAAEMAVHAAELYLKSKDVEKAIENWSRAVGMNPEHLIAHSRLAIVYERLGRKPKAVQEYLHIASLMQHAGEKGKAAQVINRALGVSPNSEKALQSLAMLRDGITLPKPERPQGGTAPFQKTQTLQLAPPKKQTESELNPIEEAQHRALAVLATLFFEQISENDDAQASRRDLSAIVAGTGYLFAKNVDKTKLMLHLGQAVEFLTSEDTARAAEELKRVVDIGLHHPAAYYSLGLLWTKGDRLESAIRYLQRAISHPDFALGARLLMGEVLQKKGQLHEASIEYLEALRLADAQVVGPEHADGLRQLYEPSIEAHAQGAEEKQCAQLCESITDLLMRPRWQQYLKSVRQQLIPQEGDGPPTPLVEVLTEASNSQVVIAMSTVRQLAREGHPQTAMEDAFYALQHAPTYLPLHVAIGELLFSEGQVQGAIEKFRVVSRSYSVRGETGRATDMLRRVVAMAPMDINARGCLIDQLIARGESENAIDEYIQLAEVHYSMAELLEARKTYTRA
ncbi:MAG: tetratricopeptide repeat protein, partial [Chloroflexi bacterium]|nr:tetratricopeptide repeat protein [Chloroflexota bacterium]